MTPSAGTSLTLEEDERVACGGAKEEGRWLAPCVVCLSMLWCPQRKSFLRAGLGRLQRGVSASAVFTSSGVTPLSSDPLEVDARSCLIRSIAALMVAQFHSTQPHPPTSPCLHTPLPTPHKVLPRASEKLATSWDHHRFQFLRLCGG